MILFGEEDIRTAASDDEGCEDREYHGARRARGERECLQSLATLPRLDDRNISNARCDANFFIAVSKLYPSVAGEYQVEAKRDRNAG